MVVLLINTEDIIGTKEIGDLFGVSSSAVVNMQKRYSDFPLPIKRIESGPLFDNNEIIKWGELNNRLKISISSTVEIGKYKSIAVVGLPRTGKSYTTSAFAADNECFILRRTFSGAGDDFTQCAVKLVISPNIQDGYVSFNTDNEEERQYARFGEESLFKFVTDVNEYLKAKRISGQELSPSEYIEIFVPPSQMAQQILDETGLAYLVVTDTPGVSESYELVQIAEAHLVMLVLADSGGDTARSGFEKIVPKIAPLVASGDACFLYNLKKQCDDEEEYALMQMDAETAMRIFENDFAALKSSIVETSMTLLNPSKYVLGIPTLKDRKINTSEKIFREKFKSIIIRAFKGESINAVLEELKTAFNNKEIEELNQYQNFIESIIPNLVSNKSDILEEDYIHQFKKNKHYRVKTQDNYRIINGVSVERNRALYEIYKIFKEYTIENTPSIIHQAIVKLYYKMITEELKGGEGIGVGTHHWEDYPPITMNAIEFILAQEIQEEFTKDISSLTYRKAMEDNGVKSDSWGFVIIDKNQCYKLELICNSKILNLHSTNLYELIRNRYIRGLILVGQEKASQLYNQILN